MNWMSWERMAKNKATGGLGFRNFRDFNIAMLGKQGWRFIIYPDSLVSKLYKAKYYAKVDFLQSTLGQNPSFIWRSIFEAKQILTEGIRWRIGNGEKINILRQPWLLNDDHPFITSNNQAIEHKTVASLLCTDRKQWDVDLVEDIFNRRDRDCILNTPLQPSNNDDILYWRLENSGIYSVKSAYQHLQKQKEIQNFNDSDNIWKQLWCIKAPPKTLNLVWRALSSCLPTLVQLRMKHVQVQGFCPVCQEEEETTMHSLVSCRYAKQCWNILLPRNQWDEILDFKDWLQDVLSSVSTGKQAEVITLCWAIWRARNDLVWNQKSTTVFRIVAAAQQYLTQWKLAQGRLYTATLQPQVEGDGAVIWAKPPPNTVKVSADAAVFEDRQGVGFGLIARDSEGMLIEAKANFQYQVCSPVLAEAMAVKEALSWIDKQHWNSVMLETDCLVVVQAIRSKATMRSMLGLIIDDCRMLLKRLHKVSLSFVKRSANMVAHKLARRSYDFSGCSFDRFSIPIDIQSCMELDLQNE